MEAAVLFVCLSHSFFSVDVGFFSLRTTVIANLNFSMILAI